MEAEEFVAGQAAADRLMALRPAGELDPNVAGAIAMCYLHVDRIDEGNGVIAELPPGPGARRVAVPARGRDGRRSAPLPRASGRARYARLPGPPRPLPGAAERGARAAYAAVGGRALEPGRGAARRRPSRRGARAARRVLGQRLDGEPGAPVRRDHGRPRPHERGVRRCAPGPRADRPQRRAEHDAALPVRGDARAAAASRPGRRRGGAGRASRRSRARAGGCGCSSRSSCGTGSSACSPAMRETRRRVPAPRRRADGRVGPAAAPAAGGGLSRRGRVAAGRRGGGRRGRRPRAARRPSARARTTCSCRRCTSSRPSSRGGWTRSAGPTRAGTRSGACCCPSRWRRAARSPRTSTCASSARRRS